MDDRESRMWLSACVEPGTTAIAASVASVGASQTWRQLQDGDFGQPLAHRATVLALHEILQLARKHRVRFVIPGDDEWPDGLADLAEGEPVQSLGGTPFGLWVRGPGSLADLVASSVGIVGSRAATPYGSEVAIELASDLAERGVCVVSGGAFGIDAAAHRGALASGSTIAVMAGGLDLVYPPGNADLLERIGRTGCLVSEVPPGGRPSRVRFLSRNRLIAAMTPGVVLVEAAERSGARNTITWANTLHRITMAVPGPVFSATSVTPHRLIRDLEAMLVTCTADVVEALGPLGTPGRVREGQDRPFDALSSTEKAAYEAFPARTSLDASEVALRAGVRMPLALAALETLTERGLLEETRVGWRRRVAP